MTLVPPLWASILLCTKGNRDPCCGNSSWRGEQNRTSWPAGPHPRCPQLQAPLASWSPGGQAAPRGGWHFSPQASQVGPGAASWGPPGPGEAGGAGGDCPTSQLGPAVEGQAQHPAPVHRRLERKLGVGEERLPKGSRPWAQAPETQDPQRLADRGPSPQFPFFSLKEHLSERLQGARHHARSFPWSPCIHLPRGRHHRH